MPKYLLNCLIALLLLHSVASAITVNKHGETVIQLIGDNYNFEGYLVNVTMDTEDSQTKEVKLRLSTYSSDSFLSTNCDRFGKLDLSNLKVDPKTKGTNPTRTVDYSRASITGFDAQANMVLAPKVWSVNSALISTVCRSQFSERHEPYGVLGLGFEGKAANNFLTDKKAFAFIVSKESKFDPSTGRSTDRIVDFLLDANTDASIRGPALKTLKTDENWRVAGSLNFKVSDGELSKDKITLIVDTELLDHRLPQDMFDLLTKKLSAAGCKETDKNFHKWTCYGSLSSLPTLTFTVGGQTFKMDPKDYLKSNYNEDEHELKVEATSETSSLPGLLSKDNSYMAIGRPLIERYYTAFTVAKKEINFYDTVDLEEKRKEDEEKAKKDQEEKDKAFWQKVIIGGVIGGILLVIIVVAAIWYIRKRKNQKRFAQAQENSNSYQQFYGQETTNA